jgi:hypothetical protein
MKVCPFVAEFFHADRLTARHEEANGRFSQLLEDT